MKEACFKLGSHDLGLSTEPSKIYAQIKEGTLTWWIDIYSGQKEIDDLDWEASLYCEDLRLDLTHWTDLGKTKIAFEDCWDEEIDDNIAGLYVFGHEDVRDTTIKITPVKDTTFHLEWKGIGLVSEEEYEVLVSTPIEFTEIICWSLDPKESDEWLSGYFDVAGYHKENPEVTNQHNGKDIGKIVYRPKINPA